LFINAVHNLRSLEWIGIEFEANTFNEIIIDFCEYIPENLRDQTTLLSGTERNLSSNTRSFRIFFMFFKLTHFSNLIFYVKIFWHVYFIIIIIIIITIITIIIFNIINDITSLW
jgi:hypothetical protein